MKSFIYFLYVVYYGFLRTSVHIQYLQFRSHIAAALTSCRRDKWGCSEKTERKHELDISSGINLTLSFNHPPNRHIHKLLSCYKPQQGCFQYVSFQSDPPRAPLACKRCVLGEVNAVSAQTSCQDPSNTQPFLTVFYMSSSHAAPVFHHHFHCPSVMRFLMHCFFSIHQHLFMWNVHVSAVVKSVLQ